MTNLTVRMEPVVVEHRDDFLAMAEQLFLHINPEFVPRPDWKQYYFENILSNSEMSLRWILVGNDRAGFILYGLEKHRFLPRRTGAIYELYLRPEFRRKGIAARCAKNVIQELQAQSPSKIQLEVVDGNQAAIALWQSLGFERVSSRFVLKNTVK
jgi:ribosomal protein S18 acetylase RimI-like enzyme